MNEFSINHSNNGKLDYNGNLEILNKNNLRCSVYFKNEILDDATKSMSKFKFNLDSNKLFLFGFNKEGKAGEFNFKDYFKNITLAGYYGFSPVSDVFCIAGVGADLNPESRSLLTSAVTLSVNYKDFKKTLNFGRVEGKNLFIFISLKRN